MVATPTVDDHRWDRLECLDACLLLGPIALGLQVELGVEAVDRRHGRDRRPLPVAAAA